MHLDQIGLIATIKLRNTTITCCWPIYITVVIMLIVMFEFVDLSALVVALCFEVTFDFILELNQKYVAL